MQARMTTDDDKKPATPASRSDLPESEGPEISDASERSSTSYSRKRDAFDLDGDMVWSLRSDGRE